MAPALALLLKQLAAMGASTIANAVIAKGKTAVEEKLGIDLESAVGTEEGRERILTLQIQHEEFLVEAALRKKAQELEEAKLEVEDTQDARGRDKVFLEKGKENWRAHVLALLAIGVIVWLTWLVVSRPDLNEFAKSAFLLLLGRFTGYIDQVYNFEFGRTKANQAKDDTINDLIRSKK